MLKNKFLTFTLVLIISFILGWALGSITEPHPKSQNKTKDSLIADETWFSPGKPNLIKTYCDDTRFLLEAEGFPITKDKLIYNDSTHYNDRLTHFEIPKGYTVIDIISILTWD